MKIHAQRQSWSCIDYWNYANRQINIQSNLVINDTWESCEDCIGGTDSIASNYDEDANYNILYIIILVYIYSRYEYFQPI